MYETSREFPRIASKNVLKVGTFDSVVEDVHVSRDICRGGCQFESNTSYGVGKVLAIHMLLSTSTIKPIGTVVWEQRNGNGHYDVGVEFTLVSPEDAAALKQFVSFCSPYTMTA